MNIETDTDERTALLDDLLHERFDLDAVRDLALAELRRKQARRQRIVVPLSVMSGLAAATLAFLAIVGVDRQPPEVPNRVSRPSPPLGPIKAVPAPPERKQTVKEISDAQLLAQFPPGSCTLAEFDGKTVLVFNDPEEEAKYLR